MKTLLWVILFHLLTGRKPFRQKNVMRKFLIVIIDNRWVIRLLSSTMKPDVM